MMRLVKTTLTAVLATLAITGVASAATIGFDDVNTGVHELYYEGGYAFSPVRIVNGNCLSGGCAALNHNETMTMTLVDGGFFDLEAVAFSLLGKGDKVIRARDKTKKMDGGKVLTLTTDQNVSVSFSTADFNDGENHLVKLDPSIFTALRSVMFSTGAGGNVRLDLVYAAAASFGAQSAPAVPLPATAWLLLGALGGLGLARFRRAAV